MKFDKTKICLVTDEKERLYYLGFAATDGYVMLEDGKTTFVVDNRYLYAARNALAPKGIDVVCGSDYSALSERVKAISATVVGIDYATVTLSGYAALEKALPDVKFIDVGNEIVKEMSIKSDAEIEIIKKACAIAEKSFVETLPYIKAGVTEREIAARLEFQFKQNGASDKSFDTIIAFGAGSAVPHHETGETKLTENAVVLMDFGCIYKGYCSDMTRTLYFGKPTEKFLHAYRAVYEAHFNALKNIKAGMTGKEADALARSVLEKYGIAQYFTHSLGHGIGVHIHEHPYLSPRADNVLENKMVFSDEPGVYFDGEFGIRIEDSCYLSGGITHTFMKDDKKLIVIDGAVSKQK